MVSEAEYEIFVEGIRVSNHASVFRGIFLKIFPIKKLPENRFLSENEQVVVSNTFHETPIISGDDFGKVRKFGLTSDIKPLLKIFLVQNQAHVVCYVSSTIFWTKIQEKYLLLHD